MDNCRVGGDAEPLLPRLMESPYKETQQRGPAGKLHANEVADPGQREIAAVEEDALENLFGKRVERVARRPSSHDGRQRFPSSGGLEGRLLA